MSLFSRIIGGLFGGGAGSTVEQVAGVFSENRERGAQRAHDSRMGALDQMAAELHGRGFLNQIADFLNRLPRPVIVSGVIYMFWLAMERPTKFAEAMTGLQLVPEPMWWLLGAVVTFYFGARELKKSRDLKISTSRVKAVVEQVREIRTLRDDTPGVAADDSPEANEAILADQDNAAIAEFRRSSG